MKYSKEEVMQFVQEEDVKFIRLAFCDVFGRQKNIAIMPSELSRAFEYGIAFDASADVYKRQFYTHRRCLSTSFGKNFSIWNLGLTVMPFCSTIPSDEQRRSFQHRTDSVLK